MNKDHISCALFCAAGDAMAVVEQGSARRRTTETRMNQESSRSHAVLTVYIESWTKADESDVECIRSSRLNLIDLAGASFHPTLLFSCSPELFSSCISCLWLCEVLISLSDMCNDVWKSETVSARL